VVIAAVDLHPGWTKMRSVRPSFEMWMNTITGRLNVDLVRNVSQI